MAKLTRVKCRTCHNYERDHGGLGGEGCLVRVGSLNPYLAEGVEQFQLKPDDAKTYGCPDWKGGD